MFDIVIGAGQGGCRIAAEFADVFKIHGRYLNVADVDFGDLRVPRSHTLVVGGEGTGRDPTVGEQVARDFIDDIRTFLGDSICLVEDGAETVLLCIGGGGGSGTGMLFPILEFLVDFNEGVLDIFLLYTMPQKKEGIPAKPNALRGLNRVIREYMKGDVSNQISVMLVDNDFCRDKYKSHTREIGSGYWTNVNRGIAKALRRFLSLTDAEKMSKVDMTAGSGALDYAELYRVMYFKRGFVDIREARVEVTDLQGGVDLYKKELSKKIRTSSMVFGSLDIRTTKAYVVLVAMPTAWKLSGEGEDFVTTVFDLLYRATRTSFVLRASFYSSKIKTARITMVLAGMAKSHGLDKILKQTIKDTEKFSAKEDVDEMDLSELDF